MLQSQPYFLAFVTIASNDYQNAVTKTSRRIERVLMMDLIQHPVFFSAREGSVSDNGSVSVFRGVEGNA
jgi:hypothetical protein